MLFATECIHISSLRRLFVVVVSCFSLCGLYQSAGADKTDCDT